MNTFAFSNQEVQIRSKRGGEDLYVNLLTKSVRIRESFAYIKRQMHVVKKCHNVTMHFMRKY